MPKRVLNKFIDDTVSLIAAVWTKAWKTLDGKKIVVLGSTGVGKSSLLYFLKNEKVNPGIAATPLPAEIGDVTIRYRKKEAVFNVPVDVPGFDHYKESPNWKGPFEKADFAWYLFRSDLILAGDERAIKEMQADLDKLNSWNQSLGINSLKIMLIGTWADRSEMYENHEDAFRESIDNNGFLKNQKTKLSAELVAGSLSTNKDAYYLLRQIEKKLT